MSDRHYVDPDTKKPYPNQKPTYLEQKDRAYVNPDEPKTDAPQPALDISVADSEPVPAKSEDEVKTMAEAFVAQAKKSKK